MMENIDPETGISYGCISIHSLNLNVMDRWFQNDRFYEEAKNKFSDDLRAVLTPHIPCDVDIADLIGSAIDVFDMYYQNDDPGWYYKDGEFEAIYYPDLFCWVISKSPYYMFARNCSPNLPNAGDCDAPSEEYGKKTYCLPNEFFDNREAPYKYYSVEDMKDDPRGE